MKSYFIIFKIFLITLCGLYAPISSLQAMVTPITLEDDGSGICKITVLKSTGEIQTDVYAKVFANYKKFEPDENGVISVEYTSSTYTHTVTLYFNDAPETYKKKIEIDTESNEMTVYFDRIQDIQEYKRTGRIFPIEGMVIDDEANPIEGATVSVQGTGRRTLTDEMGLFKLDGDFIHNIVIRADGMDNLSLPVTHFLEGEAGFNITMKRKNGWKLYASAEQMPEFPGGMQAFQRYLKKHLVYPPKALKAKKEGVVVVQFVVEVNGSISNPQIARHLEESMDSAAWRLIKNMPSWIPASDYGTKVRCKYSLPVAFNLPKPKPIIPVDSLKLDSIRMDSLAMDSLAMDSLMDRKVLVDSLQSDSLHRLLPDSIGGDSLKSVLPLDSLQQDSTRMQDQSQTVVKAKKRNVFVRFFRWLFGIERRQRKRAEKELMLKAQNDSINMLSTSPAIPNAKIEVSGDSVQLELDSLHVNVNDLKKKLKTFAKEKQANDSIQAEQTTKKK